MPSGKRLFAATGKLHEDQGLSTPGARNRRHPRRRTIRLPRSVSLALARLPPRVSPTLGANGRSRQSFGLNVVSRPAVRVDRSYPIRANARRSQAKDQGDRPLRRRGELPLARLGRPRSPDQQLLRRRQALRHRPPQALPAPPPARRVNEPTRGGGRRLDSPKGNPSRGKVTAALGRHRAVDQNKRAITARPECPTPPPSHVVQPQRARGGRRHGDRPIGLSSGVIAEVPVCNAPNRCRDGVTLTRRPRAPRARRPSAPTTRFRADGQRARATHRAVRLEAVDRRRRGDEVHARVRACR